MKPLTKNWFLPFITALRWMYLVVMSPFILIPTSVPFLSEFVSNLRDLLPNRVFLDMVIMVTVPTLFIFFYVIIHRLTNRYPRTMASLLTSFQAAAVIMVFVVFVLHLNFFRTPFKSFCVGNGPCLMDAGFSMDPFERIVWSKVIAVWFVVVLAGTVSLRFLFRKHVGTLLILCKAVSILFTGLLLAPFFLYLYYSL